MVATAPAILVELDDPPDGLLELAGKRLRVLRNAGSSALLAAQRKALGVQHLSLRPDAALHSLDRLPPFRLVSLDVRGCFGLIPALPEICTSALKQLRAGWYSEADPSGRGAMGQDLMLFRETSPNDLISAIAERAPNLEVLEFMGTVTCREHQLNLTGLQRCPCLNTLRLPFSPAIDLAEVASLTLRDLGLRGCTEVGNVQALGQLDEVNLSCVPMRPEDAIHVARGARVIDLCYCEHLTRTVLPPLVRAAGSQVTMFGGGGWGLNDADLTLIAQEWPSLTSLGIGSAKCTATGLQALHGLQKLTRLSAHRLTGLREEAVTALLRALPLEAIDLDDSSWEDGPSEELTAILASKVYHY